MLNYWTSFSIYDISNMENSFSFHWIFWKDHLCNSNSNTIDEFITYTIIISTVIRAEVDLQLIFPINYSIVFAKQLLTVEWYEI